MIERLAEHDDGAVEYRARNPSLPGIGPRVRLRVIPFVPYLPEPERLQQRHQLGNAYSTLHRLPGGRLLAPGRQAVPVVSIRAVGAQWVLGTGCVRG